MKAEDLVRACEVAGLALEPRGDGVLYVAPRERLTPALREALLAHKAEILAYLRSRALGVDWVKVSLHELDCILEVAVPWSDVRLVIAPGCRVVRELRAQDPQPGRIWCTCEIRDLLLAGVSPGDARKVAEARLVMRSPEVRARPTKPGANGGTA